MGLGSHNTSQYKDAMVKRPLRILLWPIGIVLDIVHAFRHGLTPRYS